jgi:hypothetical protein
MLNLKPLAEFFETEMTEGFLEVLLNAMRLAFLFDGKFCRNIENFSGKYFFTNHDKDITVSAVFHDGSMSVSKHGIEHPDITITFRDEKALMGFVLAPKPDILGAVLRQDVVIDGNLNYLYKFAFMAKRLQLMAMCQI